MCDKIYHYTKFANFIKIIESNTFILSSFENANDSKEKVKRVFENGEVTSDYKYLSACDCNGLDNGIDTQSYSNSMLWYHYAEKGNGDTITMIPDNKEYPEQTIGKEMIQKVYKIMGSVKMF